MGILYVADSISAHTYRMATSQYGSLMEAGKSAPIRNFTTFHQRQVNGCE